MAAAVNWTRLTEPWPDPASLADIQGVPVSWPSSSPFAIEDIGGDPDDAPPTTAQGRLYLPPGQHALRSVPAVVLLHGSGGILPMRELTYAPQLARMGVAALVVDSFGARRDRGTEFIERILNITETMALADAYSGLGFLAAHPEIDPRRVVLTGFSYGAMATLYRACRLLWAVHRPLRGQPHHRSTAVDADRRQGRDRRPAALRRGRGGSAVRRQPGRDDRLPGSGASMGRRLRRAPDRPQPRRLLAARRARRDDPRYAYWPGHDRALHAQGDPRPVYARGRP